MIPSESLPHLQSLHTPTVRSFSQLTKEIPMVMDKLLPFHCHQNPPLQQNPLPHKPKPGTHSPTFLSFAPTVTSHEPIQLSAALSPTHWSNYGSSDVKTLESVKAMHAQMIKTCNKWSKDAMTENLIASYLEFSDFRSAATAFLMGFWQNFAMRCYLLAQFENFGGDPVQILEVFKELQSKGVVFDSRVITVILKFCTSLMDLWLGLEVHASLIKRGFELNVHVNCALMHFYGRCWGVESANRVFYDTLNPDHLLWNEVTTLNLKNGRYGEAMKLFRQMQFSFAKASSRTILKMLQVCGKEGALDEGKQIHGYVLKHELKSNLSVCNCLISMYSRNDELKLARLVFDSMKDHNLSSWNSIISSYSAHGSLSDAWNLFHKMDSLSIKPDIITWNCLLSGQSLHGSYREALTILRRMQAAGFRPNSSSASTVLQAVIELRLLNFGKEIHGYAIRNGLDYDVYVGTSLLDMYVKNDCLASAQAIFDNMENKNIFAWNSLISGYSYKGLFDDAKRLLNQMEEEGFKPDLVTWNGLVSGYSIWSQTKESLEVINNIKNLGLTPNVVSWTALVSGCSQNGNYRESLDFFIQMRQEGIQPNSATMSSLLRTCGGLCLMQKGKEIHCLCTRNGFIEDVYITTALIDMYGKSGDLTSAYRVFKKTKNKTLASWNCMIMGFAIYGFGSEAASLFNEMLGAGLPPDAITFTALLSSCKNSGLVHEGWKYFDSMKNDYDIQPTIEHYCCMVDLLGRAGYLDEAWDFIQTMPIKPDSTVWGAFLGSCRIHRNLEFAEIAAKKLFQLEPDNSANYMMMMNLYSLSSRWDDAERIKDLMDVKGLKYRNIWSWIQIDQTVHVFSAGGKAHQDEGEIYFELYQLVSEMKKSGYVPDISCVSQNIDEVEKERMLLSHTEKLAMTYGLIKTSSSAPIRVFKTTRTCSDCHTAAKYMSLVRNREIYLRDSVRFHHFKSGKCSCNDYW